MDAGGLAPTEYDQQQRDDEAEQHIKQRPADPVAALTHAHVAQRLQVPKWGGWVCVWVQPWA
jgi:hypothetical protein